MASPSVPYQPWGKSAASSNPHSPCDSSLKQVLQGSRGCVGRGTVTGASQRAGIPSVDLGWGPLGFCKVHLIVGSGTQGLERQLCSLGAAPDPLLSPCLEVKVEGHFRF